MRQGNGGGSGLVLGLVLGGGMVFGLGVVGFVGLVAVGMAAEREEREERAERPKQQVTQQPVVQQPVAAGYFDPKQYETPVVITNYQPVEPLRMPDRSWLGQQTGELPASAGYGYSGSSNSYVPPVNYYDNWNTGYSNSYAAPPPMTAWEYLGR